MTLGDRLASLAVWSRTVRPVRRLRHHPDSLALQAWFDGEEAEGVAWHVAACRQCYDEMSQLAWLRAAVRGELPPWQRRPFPVVRAQRSRHLLPGGRAVAVATTALALTAAASAGGLELVSARPDPHTPARAAASPSRGSPIDAGAYDRAGEPPASPPGHRSLASPPGTSDAGSAGNHARARASTTASSLGPVVRDGLGNASITARALGGPALTGTAAGKAVAGKADFMGALGLASPFGSTRGAASAATPVTHAPELGASTALGQRAAASLHPSGSPG
ncbi:MAG: hypothetical protein ACYCTL_13705 [Acidimicrobiales bacterium]